MSPFAGWPFFCFLFFWLTGDHKQLRPKVEQYSLRVESGRGFDLNVSLFERLVNNGYPLTTLELQHRMPPEVSQPVTQSVSQSVSQVAAIHLCYHRRAYTHVLTLNTFLGQPAASLWGLTI